MKIERRLERWQAEGVIDAAVAGRIARWEEENRQPVVLPVLGTLGAGTLALGIVALVAANWDAIPGQVKIGCDLATALALAVATFVAVRREAELATDVLVVVLWGFTLASITLVGQVYQVDAPLWRVLLSWTLATGPLALLAHSGPAAGLAALGVLATQGVGLAAAIEWMFESSGIDRWNASNAAAVLLAASPLPWIVLGRARRFAARWPTHAAAVEVIGWIGWSLLALAACLVWYERGRDALELGWSLPVLGGLVAGLVAALPTVYPGWPSAARFGIAAAGGIAWISLACGRIPGREAMPATAALAQIGVLSGLAWASARVGRVGLFRCLAALVGLRIFAVYIEVFGSLLRTGFGLVVGGLLLLGLTWLWSRRAADLAGRIAAPVGVPPADRPRGGDRPDSAGPGRPGAGR